MHFLRIIYFIFFLPKSRLHTFFLHFFVIQRLFFKLDSNQLKDLSLCIFRWELEHRSQPLGRISFFNYFFAFFAQIKTSSVCFSFFSYSKDFCFNFFFLPTFKIFFYTSFSIYQKKITSYCSSRHFWTFFTFFL